MVAKLKQANSCSSISKTQNFTFKQFAVLVKNSTWKLKFHFDQVKGDPPTDCLCLTLRRRRRQKNPLLPCPRSRLWAFLLNPIRLAPLPLGQISPSGGLASGSGPRWPRKSLPTSAQSRWIFFPLFLLTLISKASLFQRHWFFYNPFPSLSMSL